MKSNTIRDGFVVLFVVQDLKLIELSDIGFYRIFKSKLYEFLSLKHAFIFIQKYIPGTSIIKTNKLELSWAKLSSSWDWALL